ncbi:MAG: ABC transporter substrate-binding protein [Pyrinomonadaceae bacterium]
MKRFPVSLLILLILIGLFFSASCRRDKNFFVMALSSNPESLDPMQSQNADGERLRQLIFNSLIRKNETLEYVGDLAESYQISGDKLSVTFILQRQVKFHNGKHLTSADAKYSLETLLDPERDYRKAASFFEGAGNNRKSFIVSVEAPDETTLIVHLRKPFAKLLSNLVAIPIIPQGSADQQKTHPLGSGAFKFVRFDASQQMIDLEANQNYWEGAPEIGHLRVRTILDGNSIQAELISGRLDCAFVTNISPDAYRALAKNPRLQVVELPGSNVDYLAFNTQSKPVNDPRLRQAIGYGIDRESLIKYLLLDQFQIAYSILPPQSWGYASGIKYSYDPRRARSILDEAGLKDPDGDGRVMRLTEPIVLKVSASNTIRQQIAGVIQNNLKEIGLPVRVETVEDNILFDQQRKGQYQMSISQWVGGNQDPIFLKDLFGTGEAFNRTRYSNVELDQILNEASESTDRVRAFSLYSKAQDIVSRDLPMLALWYKDNMIVARQGVSNIKVDASGDWSFVGRLKISN